jgi:hypothetical protein
MLAIVAVTLAAVVATLVCAQIIDVRRCPVRDVGIHVPHHTVTFVVGAPKSIPQLAIRDGSMAFDDVVKCNFQLIASQTIGRIVIVDRLGSGK